MPCRVTNQNPERSRPITRTTGTLFKDLPEQKTVVVVEVEVVVVVVVVVVIVAVYCKCQRCDTRVLELKANIT